MKKIFLVTIILCLSIATQAIEITKSGSELFTDSFLKSPSGDSVVWIGAIRADSAHIPAGKRFLSRETGTPEYKSIWKNINPLSRKSIILRKSFVAHKAITKAVTSIC